MITTNDIKKYAKANSIEIDEVFASSYNRDCFADGSINYISSKRQYYKIGLRMQKYVWFWWTSFDYDGYDRELHFAERYNMNNGASQKSFSKGFNAEIKIKLDNL